jgi:hypothetical protein
MRRMALAGIALASLAGAALADEQPSIERLKEALAQEAPPFWTVGDLS